jgi:hypothetical protein
MIDFNDWLDANNIKKSYYLADEKLNKINHEIADCAIWGDDFEHLRDERESLIDYQIQTQDQFADYKMNGN